MLHPLLRFAGAALVLACLGRAEAFDIDTVNGGTAEVHGALGTELTIEGSGFGTAKPKAFLDFEGQLYALKVTEFDDTHIVATVKKGTLGTHVLRVRPKGSTEDFTFDSIVLEAPAIDELQDALSFDPITEASPNEEFYITGDFFGVKKNKIFIGGKKAKVISWAMTGILLQMPKSLPNGLKDILLKSKLGTDEDETITMVGSLVKIGKVGLTVTIGSGAGAETIKFKYAGGAVEEGLLIFGGSTTGDPIRQVAFTIPFDIDSDTAPLEIDSTGNAAMLVSYNEIEKPLLQGKAANWIVSLGEAGAIAYISAVSGGQVGGTLVADLPLLSNTTGHAVDDPLHIEATFVYEP